MLCRKLFPIIFLPALLLCGCVQSFAPEGWLPETDDYPMNVYGGWMTITAESDSVSGNGELLEYMGEYITDDSSYVYIAADRVYPVEKEKIKNARLELDVKHASGFALWGAAFLLTPALNGYYCVFTGPLGLLSGIGAATSESGRDTYQMNHPGEKFWNEIRKFSRFPQGIPEGIDIKSIKPVISQASEE